MQSHDMPEPDPLELPPADDPVSTASSLEEADAEAEAEALGAPLQIRRSRLPVLFDLLVVALLIAIALPIRWQATHGDFWLDEADYALASVRGIEANRWDLPERGTPDKIIRLRHYHPPLIAHVIGLASRSGMNDRHLRLPSVIAGALTVALLYLCGLYLFAPRGDPAPASAWAQWTPRFIAAACAVALLRSPAHIRASSHALPWSFITLWLVAIALCMAAYARTRRPIWLVALGAALGVFFATSEYVVVAGLAVGLALPALFWRDVRDGKGRKRVLIACLGGVAAILIIGFVLWPAGLAGGLVKMLRHYMEMAGDPWPVIIDGRTYERAPKWAYAYWYKQYYPAYAGWYVLGFVGLAAMTVTRRLTVGVAAVALLTGIVLLAAHKSHIIGPEYLVHALPLMTLLGGLFFAAIAELHRPSAAVLALLGAAAVYFGPVRVTLSGMDDRAQVSRWPAAAAYLKAHWTPATRMLAPAYGGGGRWYVLYGAGLRVEEWRVQALPASSANDKLVDDIAMGVYKYIAVGSTFSDWPSVDNRIRKIIATWPVTWQSDEHGTGPSRLTIYQLPTGVNRLHPLPIPEE